MQDKYNQGFAAPPGYGAAQPPPPPGFIPTGSGAPGQFPPFGGVYNDGNTVESNAFLGGGSAFSEIRIRHQFIRKVYSLVSLQLLITLAFCALFKFADPVRGFFEQNVWLLYVSMFGTIIVMLVLACCESVARSFPINLILLFFFTLMESLLVGCITTRYKTDTVLIAVGLTCLVVVGITLFAFQTKIDFTGCGIYLFVLGLILFGFGLLAILFRSEVLQILYAAGGTALFSFYLIFDTQIMMGGKHKYAISPEDYILAALNLYVDIINLFLMILRLVSAVKD